MGIDCSPYTPDGPYSYMLYRDSKRRVIKEEEKLKPYSIEELLKLLNDIEKLTERKAVAKNSQKKEELRLYTSIIEAINHTPQYTSEALRIRCEELCRIHESYESKKHLRL